MIQSLQVGIGLFIIAAIVIGLVGTKMCKVADQLADATGWGEAVVGAVFLGGSTSLSGIVTSVTAAAGGHAELAVSNAVGGIAAQTAFLAVADMFYRKANLEHSAASIANLIQGTLLMSLLAIPLLASSSPQVSFAIKHIRNC
ncbi:MAG: sodium:calcium antiporter, partial [Cyanobacteria bacterium J06628_3]